MPPTNPVDEFLQRKFRKLLSEVTDGALLKNYVVVLDCVDTDGEPMLIHMTNPELSYWVMKGAVETVLEGKKAQAGL